MLRARTPPAWQVYILRCGDGSLYTGIARDVAARLAQHQAGHGARYTRGRGPLVLVHLEPATSHGDALRREAAIRRLGRAGKKALAAAYAKGAPLSAAAAEKQLTSTAALHAPGGQRAGERHEAAPILPPEARKEDS